MIRIAIIDNDYDSTAKLRGFVEEFFKAEGVEFFVAHFDQGINFISDYRADFDIIFLETENANMDGFETAKYLRERDKEFCLVFCAKTPQFAVRGYEFDAINFIVKPILKEVVFTTLKKAMKIIKKKVIEEESSFVLKIGSQYRRYNFDEVFFVEVFGHDLVYNFEKDSISTKSQLSYVEDLFVENGFFRCFHSCLVNLSKIKDVSATKLVLTNGKELPISRRKKNELFKTLRN